MGDQADGCLLRNAFGDTFVQTLVGGACDTGDCDYYRSSRVSVADTGTLGPSARVGTLGACVNTENLDIPHDLDVGIFIASFVQLECALECREE